ncbi:unnamed protein product [Blepharisma stoltei]|uniref:Peptidase A1 domain-containing protein n=1 Tax=Blepharisma stoltei TaxID=1481888 RepID=A0AAU9J228_9CILI|nr:unnamed protein product [Blepharisma stoltei]
MILWAIVIIVYADCQNLEHIIVHGNVEDLGYYYIDIFVGNPPAKQSVIIDTGSRLTAFPCKGCKTCGQHMNPYFDFDKSQTSKFVACNDSEFCTNCNDDKCEYKISYAEGSIISGLMIEDYILIGDDKEHLANISYKFGCHQEETNLFKSQKVDGIMGLAFSHKKSTIVDQIYKNSDSSENLLAICLGKDDGYMTIGGYNQSLHFDTIKWTKLYEDLFYTIGLKSVSIGYQILPIDLKKAHKKTIIDSGTTFVYFIQEMYKEFWVVFENYCKNDNFCDGEVIIINNEPKSCYKRNKEKHQSIYEFFDTFPTISMTIDKIIINWLPENYLFSYPEYADIYCVGIYSTQEDIIVLGNIFMRGMEVIFDRSESRVGFAESSCDPLLIHGNSGAAHERHKRDLLKSSRSDSYFNLGLSITAFLVFYSIYLVMKKSKLWKKE